MRAVLPQTPEFFEQSYLPSLMAALHNRELEEVLAHSWQMQCLPKDTLNRIPSKAIHLDVGPNFEVIGLRFCSAWFHEQWAQVGSAHDNIALAFGAWMSGTLYEAAVLSTMPYVGALLVREINRDSVNFAKLELPVLPIRDGVSTPHISEVRTALLYP